MDITPQKGVELGGYPYFDRPNTGPHDPLIASALFLEEDGASALIIATDLFWITRSQADSIRSEIERKTRIPAESVVITCSHTHSAPWMSVVFEASDEQPDFVTRIDKGYIAFVRDQCVRAAERAARSPFAASIEVGLGRCGADEGIGGNRRMPDGGIVDEELPALVVKDESGTVRAIWTKYSLHPTILHGESTAVSADFPGALRRRLGAKIPESTLLYSMGAAGDQSPRYFAESKDFAQADRFGAALSRALIESASKAAPLGCGRLAVATRQVVLEPRTYPPIEAIESDLEALKAREGALKRSGASRTDLQNANLAVLGKECEVNNARRGAAYANERFAACSPFEVLGIALDRRTAIVFLPGELFCQFGAAIRTASPFTRTFVVTMSNGDLPGYCVTARAREEGGYEPGNSLLEVTGGARLVAGALDVLVDLFEEEGAFDAVQ